MTEHPMWLHWIRRPGPWMAIEYDCDEGPKPVSYSYWIVPGTYSDQ